MKQLSYTKLPNSQAKVTCICGWESAEFVPGTFDPEEALVAYQVDHLECLESPPEVFYAVAQGMYGKMIILSDPDSSPGARERMEQIAKGLAQKGMVKHVLEIKISSSWIG